MISIITGHDTTLLEDWLVDTETAADLMTGKQNQTCSGQVKRFDTCTLITEAITSGKS